MKNDMIDDSKTKVSSLIRSALSDFKERFLIRYYLLVLLVGKKFGVSSQLSEFILLIESFNTKYFANNGNHDVEDSFVIALIKNGEWEELFSVYEKLFKEKLDLDFLVEHYNESVEFLITDNFFENASETKFMQVPEVTKVVALLAGFQNGSEVYNPFAGYGSYALEMSNVNYYGEDIHPLAVFMANIRLSILDNDVLDKNEHKVALKNSLDTLSDNRCLNLFDGIISTPPIIIERSKDVISQLEYKLLVSGMALLNESGKMIVVLPQSFLDASRGNLFDIKNTLLEKKWIESIITLPIELSRSTKTNMCILILSKKNNQKIRMFDGSSFYHVQGRNKSHILDYKTLIQTWNTNVEIEGISCNVEVQQLFNTKCDLTPSRFLISFINNYKPENFKPEELGEFITKANPVKHNDTFGFCVKTNELAKNIKECIKESSSFSEDTVLPNYKKYTAPVLVIASRFQRQYPTYCIASEEYPIYMNPGYVAFNIKEDLISPEYLYYSITQEYCDNQIKNLRKGFYKSISPADLLTVKILIPMSVDQNDSVSKQKIIVDNFLKVGIVNIVKEKGLQNLIREEKEKYKNYVSYKKHSISPLIGNLRANLNMLKVQAESNDGKVNFSDYITDDYTVNELINNMQDIYIELDTLVKSLISEESVEKGETLNIGTILSEYVNSRRILFSTFRIEFTSEIENSAFIFFSKVNFYEVLDSILNNAQRHGFSAINKSNKVVISVSSNQNDVIISVANNGKPMPENLTSDLYFMNGWSDGPTKNTGIGGYRIKELVEHFDSGAHAKLINEPKEKYPVKLVITLPKV
jgi:type I restriction enzyme M protein